jgi:hypothetical protein
MIAYIPFKMACFCSSSSHHVGEGPKVVEADLWLVISIVVVVVVGDFLKECCPLGALVAVEIVEAVKIRTHHLIIQSEVKIF